MIVGIDEVGRGCWAGPLVAGAVVLHTEISGLQDSKKISAATRKVLDELIYRSASVGLGWVSPKEVDDMGLTRSVRVAMQRALYQIDEQLYDEIIIDGSYNFLDGLTQKKTKAIVRADGSIPAVSASSIVAKVARDTYMQTLTAKYDCYGFASHVGYGTAQHQQALVDYGVSDIHRMSYKPIKRLLERLP
jgi:ribonuclease HII